jgi:hypothetical protein
VPGAGHTWPQLPQFCGSVAVAVQTPGLPMPAPQTTSVATVQLGPHTPALQGMPIAHAVPHTPQWFGSVIRLAQTPPQAVVPAGHAH